jgi:hypothetical protein
MNKASIVTGVLLTACLCAEGGEVAFTSKPAVQRKNGLTTVSFTVNRSTDVAVYVLDAKGKCVRHLAAGVLSEKAPAPLKPGLEQSVVWDGKDDYGKAATGGPFKVRVALGLKPEFGGFLLHHRDMLPPVARLAVGPKGELYCFYIDPASLEQNNGGFKIRVRSREGKHLRTLLPIPAGMEPERYKAFGAFFDEDGHVVPRIFNWQSMALQPHIGGFRKDVHCHAPVASSKRDLYWIVRGNGLACLSMDGGTPYPTFLSKGLTKAGLRGYMALSSDEKHLYLSANDHAVYRVDLQTRKAAPFIGNPGKAGGEALLKGPQGLAAAKGLVYVADRGNDRIAIFKETDGSYVSERKTPKPYHVSVDATTGALYVISEPKEMFSRVLKFDSSTAKAPSKTMELPKNWAKKGPWLMAADTSTRPVRLYFPTRGYAKGFGGNLTAFDDVDEGFKRVGVPQPKGRYSLCHKDLTVDQRRNELYVKISRKRATWYRFDADTCEFKGKVAPTGCDGSSGGQLVSDSKGRLVTYSWRHKSKSQALRLWTREGKPIPAKTPGWSGLMNFQQNYMDVSVKDEIYVVPGSNGHMKWTAGGAGNLTVFGMDLLPKRVAVSGVSLGCIPRLDLAGNIYLAENVRPLDGNYPKFFAGKLKTGKGVGFPRREWADWPYIYMYGSIVKFPPEGGKILAKAPKDAKGLRVFRYPMRFQRNRRGALKGAQWVRFGVSPYSNINIGGGGSQNCMCEGSGFGVDGFGRVFYPNLGRFRVEVIDTNNNFIGTFGKYGNMDSGGPDAIVKTPDIPLAWPTYVAVGDTYAFVSDVASTRIVKVKLNYTAEEVCPVP